MDNKSSSPLDNEIVFLCMLIETAIKEKTGGDMSFKRRFYDDITRYWRLRAEPTFHIKKLCAVN